MSDDKNSIKGDVKAETHQICHMCKEFCMESTVHGFRFFAEPKLHWIERVWWVISCILSMILCTIAVTIIWTKWHEHPVTVTFNDKTTPVAMIPFPSVTICSTQKHKERIDLTTRDYIYPQNLFSDFNKLDAISQICAKYYYQYNESIGGLPIDQSIYAAISEISPNKSSLLYGSTWSSSGNKVNFTPIFTEEGLCFTFNSLNSDELYADEVASELKTVRENPSAANWNMEDAYQSNFHEGSEPYPYRVFGAGFQDSLQVLPGMLLDDSFRFCRFYAPGFLISLGLPDELPRFGNNYIFVPAEQNVLISVKPNMITTSESLRSYKPHVRGCYFQSERRLRFFKSYSQPKCEIECLANFTRQQIGCVRFYMPRDEKTPVCRLLDINRINKLERNFIINFMVKQCDCLPECTSIGWEVETTQVRFYHSESEEELRKKRTGNGFRAYSHITISFKENLFISLNRTETFTMPDFIASCGGLLGLFMGISLLSVVEVIYYFTLRLCCKWRRQRMVQGNLQASTNISLPPNRVFMQRKQRESNRF